MEYVNISIKHTPSNQLAAVQKLIVRERKVLKSRPETVEEHVNLWGVYNYKLQPTKPPGITKLHEKNNKKTKTDTLRCSKIKLRLKTLQNVFSPWLHSADGIFNILTKFV